MKVPRIFSSNSYPRRSEYKNTWLSNVVFLASRLLLTGIFVHEGAFLATNFAAASTAMAKVGVPALAVIGTIGLQLIAGVAIAIGWHARVGAAALALFCLATAILFHTNFGNRNRCISKRTSPSLAECASRKISYDDDGWQRLVRAFESSGRFAIRGSKKAS